MHATRSRIPATSAAKGSNPRAPHGQADQATAAYGDRQDSGPHEASTATKTRKAGELSNASQTLGSRRLVRLPTDTERRQQSTEKGVKHRGVNSQPHAAEFDEQQRRKHRPWRHRMGHGGVRALTLTRGMHDTFQK